MHGPAFLGVEAEVQGIAQGTSSHGQDQPRHAPGNDETTALFPLNCTIQKEPAEEFVKNAPLSRYSFMIVNGFTKRADGPLNAGKLGG